MLKMKKIENKPKLINGLTEMINIIATIVNSLSITHFCDKIIKCETYISSKVFSLI